MSRKLRNFQLRTLSNGFRDSLNNSSIHSNWTQEAGSSTIVEDNTDLTISDSGGSNLDWYSNFNAPNISIPVDPVDFTAMVFVSNIIATNSNAAGLCYFWNGAKVNYNWIKRKYEGTDSYISTRSSIAGEVDQYGSGGWLALCMRGYQFLCLSSINSVNDKPEIDDMHLERTFGSAFYTIKDARIALFAETLTPGFPAIAAEFRNFSLVYP